MAKAGDGNARSNSRRRSETVSLRMDQAEKDQLQKAAARDGYKTLSGWIFDRLRSDGGMGLRDRKIIIGMLGMQIEPLRRLVREGASASPDVLKDLLQAIDADAVVIQKLILKGGKSAGEGDTEPQKKG